MTEVWFRNPDAYIRELVELGEGHIAWDRGVLVKKKIDAEKHAALYFGTSVDWRLLLVGDQGTAELRPGRGLANPVGVYPTWCYGEDISLLEDLIAHPVGQNANACTDTSVPVDERPVWEQEHRVIVTDLPNVTTGPGRKFLRLLKEMQEDYPDCILHVHALYAFVTMFGMGFRAVDFEPRTSAQKGRVFLPTGKEMKFENTRVVPQWINLLGFKPADLSVPRNRCMYNIKSAKWAGENYLSSVKFKTRGEVDPQPQAIEYNPPTTTSVFTRPRLPQAGDKLQCDSCSLSDSCKYYRAEAVCSVPGSDPAGLTRIFGTRNAQEIIDGLGGLMQIQAARAERGLAEEDEYGELNPEVTKILNQLFQNGVKLAKLRDPNLNGGPKVGVFVGPGGQAQVGNPTTFIAKVVQQFEAQGIAREDITPEMIEAATKGEHPVIEAPREQAS